METIVSDNLNFRLDNGVFLPMINDTGRNIFYKSLIENNVKDKVVVDIGAGTGFLSILAAKAGAKKVYAVEGDEGRYLFLKNHVIKELELEDVIIPVHTNFLDFDIPGDIYVSETFGWHIFNENIIEIAQHAKKLGGTFLPGKVKMWVEVYENHPIFTVMQKYSDAYDFQPDVSIDPQFEKLISERVYTNEVLSKANCLPNFFNFYKHNNTLNSQLLLNKIYTTDYFEVDFNSDIDVSRIETTIPFEKIQASGSHSNDYVAAVFWQAEYGNDVMDVRDTWWSTPIRTLIDLSNDVVVKYIPSTSIKEEDILRSAYGSWYFYY